jgi:hypothetical protein
MSTTFMLFFFSFQDGKLSSIYIDGESDVRRIEKENYETCIG